MVATNYKKGTAFEYKLKRKLEADGKYHVVRSSGSHGAVDLVAIPLESPDENIKLIQLKTMRPKTKTIFNAANPPIAAMDAVMREDDVLKFAALNNDPNRSNKYLVFVLIQNGLSTYFWFIWNGLKWVQTLTQNK